MNLSIFSAHSWYWCHSVALTDRVAWHHAGQYCNTQHWHDQGSFCPSLACASIIVLHLDFPPGPALGPIMCCVSPDTIPSSSSPITVGFAGEAGTPRGHWAVLWEQVTGASALFLLSSTHTDISFSKLLLVYTSKNDLHKCLNPREILDCSSQVQLHGVFVAHWILCWPVLNRCDGVVVYSCSNSIITFGSLPTCGKLHCCNIPRSWRWLDFRGLQKFYHISKVTALSSEKILWASGLATSVMQNIDFGYTFSLHARWLIF